MAKEKLIIKNFAGFEHIEFDFKPINIFIGPQAAGKSIVVKLAYFFKSYLKNITLSYSAKEHEKEHIDLFLKYFPFDSWNSNFFEITYFSNEEIFIKIDRYKSKSIKISCSKKLGLIKQNLLAEYNIDQSIFYENHNFNIIRHSTSDKASDDSYFKTEKLNRFQYFIPAGRSFFSSIQTNIFTLLKRNQNIDPFLIDFGSNYEIAKSFRDTIFHEEKEHLEKLSDNILHSKYKREGNKEFLVHKDGRKISLSNTSSGQQEVLPLIITLLSNDRKDSLESLYIEEPEAHLYPDAQKKIVQLLAQVYNSGDKQLFITTHSPYILAAFNNLIEAGNIIKNKPQLTEKVYGIIPKEEVLKAEDLIAYSIKDGKRTVLLDEENNLISQNILDDVSNEIGAEFGKLLDLEFGE